MNKEATQVLVYVDETGAVRTADVSTLPRFRGTLWNLFIDSDVDTKVIEKPSCPEKDLKKLPKDERLEEELKWDEYKRAVEEKNAAVKRNEDIKAALLAAKTQDEMKDVISKYGIQHAGFGLFGYSISTLEQHEEME